MDIDYYKTISGLLKWHDLSRFQFLENNPERQAIYKKHLITTFKSGMVDVLDPKKGSIGWDRFTFYEVTDALEFIDERNPD